MTKKSSMGFTDEERDAMKTRALELKAEAAANKNKALGEKAVLAAIAKMPEPDRTLAKQVHAIVTSAAPSLTPKTWYGMPAYANSLGKVVCFFQNASKFKYRYSTLGFQEAAKLDEGEMWPTSYALNKLTATEEKKIIALVKKAVG
jgi:uncharacterized protein YdhG (YjbR/CyaY superfamily)